MSSSTATIQSIYNFFVAKNQRQLITVREAAEFLGVSESWVWRHIAELPAVRVGRLVKLDRSSLHRQFAVKSQLGNRMEQKGDTCMFHAALKTRYQSGRVYKKGKKVVKWYGQFREDQINADGKLVRVQKNNVSFYWCTCSHPLGQFLSCRLLCW